VTTTAEIIDSTERLPLAAKRTKVPERTLRNWIDAGQLPAWRIGGRLRVRLEDVDALAQPVEPKPKPRPPAQPEPAPPAREAPIVPSRDAARRLGTTQRAVQRMVQSGRLPGAMVAGRLLIEEPSLAALERELASIPPGSINVADAARRLGVSRNAIYHWLEQRRLRGVQAAGVWWVEPESVAAFARLHGDGLR
jgi:excisionase family DNA binding protein